VEERTVLLKTMTMPSSSTCCAGNVLKGFNNDIEHRAVANHVSLPNSARPGSTSGLPAVWRHWERAYLGRQDQQLGAHCSSGARLLHPHGPLRRQPLQGLLASTSLSSTALLTTSSTTSMGKTSTSSTISSSLPTNATCHFLSGTRERQTGC